MKVFVSYASQDRAIAEPIVHSIRARDHTVFFDKDDLPAGGTYEEQIEEAIKNSDVFVFLISPRSVASGRFTLTELLMARQKWPRPAGRILPVMIEKTDYATIPAYLKAVTVLEPAGNVAAEAAAAVDSMGRGKKRLWIAMAIATVLAIGIGAGGYMFLFTPKPKITIEASSPTGSDRGYFGAPRKYRVSYAYRNTGAIAAQLTEARFASDPPDALAVSSGTADFSSTTPKTVSPGSGQKDDFVIVPASAAPADRRWRICVTEVMQGETCSPWADWKPADKFTPATAFVFTDDLSKSAVAVARAGDDGFFLLTRNPGAIHKINLEGKVIASTTIGGPGEPTSLYADSTGVYVGARGPNMVRKFSMDDLHLLAEMPLAFPTTGDPVSSTPVSMARGGDRLWIITQGGASDAGLMHVKTDLTDPQVPPYYSTIAFSANGMVLASNGEDVWASVTNVTPASLYKFTPVALKEYTGHDYDIASCASGVLVRARDLLAPDCNGWIQAVTEDGSGLQITSQVDNLLGYKMGADIWTVVNMRPSSGNGVAFLVNSTRTVGSTVTSSAVSRINAGAGLKVPLDVEGITIVDLAAQEDRFVVILDDGQGRRETLALKYE